MSECRRLEQAESRESYWDERAQRSERQGLVWEAKAREEIPSEDDMRKNMTNFWENKKVLVTGGTGFIGSHLVEMLVDLKANVSTTILSNKGLKFIDQVKDQVRVIKCDLLDFDGAVKATKNQEIVMNLAAVVGGIEYNISHPASIFRKNLQIFMNVLEASRINNVERFLVTSSACVYPRFCTIPTPEEEGFKDTPEPTNEGYGWSKRMEEFLAKAYHKEFAMKIAIARPYNAYGPRDNFQPEFSHVIPGIIKRVFDGENPLKVWGDGKQSRSFLYATDFAQGLIDTTEKYPVADVLNLGNEREVTIGELVKLIIKISGKNIKIEFDTSKPIGQPRRNCDIKKAKEKIGFRAKVSLEEGLEKTINWYKNEYKK